MKRGFTHTKTGNYYELHHEVGIKLFRWWFYFVIYKNPQINMLFVRSKKQFNKKFKEIG